MGNFDAQSVTNRDTRANRASDSTQELANIAWAFATVAQVDAQLFMVLARAAERRIGDFDAQGLVNTA